MRERPSDQAEKKAARYIKPYQCTFTGPSEKAMGSMACR